jgi:hypothetical protein
VTLYGKNCIIARHSLAVINDPDQSAPAELDVDVDPCRTCVDRVFHELLNNRRGPLDHFACCDLVREIVREYSDLVH